MNICIIIKNSLHCFCPIGFSLIFFGVMTTGASKLSRKTKETLKAVGIKHYTTKESARAIVSSKLMRCDTSKLSYFFVNSDVDKDILSYNLLKPHKPKVDTIISIENLSEAQLNKSRKRFFDGAILFRGDFVIEDENIVQTIDFAGYDELLKYKKKFSKRYIRNYFVFPLFGCAVISLVVFVLYR